MKVPFYNAMWGGHLPHSSSTSKLSLANTPDLKADVQITFYL